LKGAAVKDEELEEKFREMTLHLERIEGEFTILRVRFNKVDNKLERLTDELTLSSGKVTQHFSSLEEQIKQLGDPSVSNL
jgi:predicted nuclease with TOPRIM domain